MGFFVSEHLTPLDGTFLELEEVDESAHMHTGAVLVFDPPPGGGPPSLEEVCRNLESRLGQLPRYRQRLSEPHTGGLSWPEWQDDPAFDLRRHVARAALPAPGGDGELAEWSSGFFSQRLDRHRPLWEMALVEGLADGRWAIATKTHHCMVDGVGSVDVGHMLLDATADARNCSVVCERRKWRPRILVVPARGGSPVRPLPDRWPVWRKRGMGCCRPTRSAVRPGWARPACFTRARR